MAVLVEAISVLVRRDAIDRSFTGGWESFLSLIPNNTFCTDGELARVGFLHPDEVGAFIEELKNCGLRFLQDNAAQDIVVVDQQRGPTTSCDWIEFAKIGFESDNQKVGAAWIFKGERMGAGVHLHDLKIQLATPQDWAFEGSLSDKFGFIPDDEHGN